MNVVTELRAIPRVRVCAFRAKHRKIVLREKFSADRILAGNGFNPISSIDPDGQVVIAATPRDMIVYAAWTKTLTPAQAKMVHKLEQSSVKYFFEIVDQPIPTSKLDPKTFEPIKVAGVCAPHGDGTGRVFDIKVWRGAGWKQVLHEFTHGEQSNDFLQANPNRTASDWGQEYDKIWSTCELQANQAEGISTNTQDLRDAGYWK